MGISAFNYERLVRKIERDGCQKDTKARRQEKVKESRDVAMDVQTDEEVIS